MSDTIERLRTEADLCRNDGANDIAKLLDQAAAELVELKANYEREAKNHSDCYEVAQQLHQQVSQLRAELDEKNSALELIGDLAYDRDGWKSAKKLGELVDEIYGYARDTKKAAEINNSKTRPEETK